MKKLELYGIRGQTLRIIKDYFQDRTQFTCMKDCSSDTMNLDYGVIQGGVLAALLFVIYINDIGVLKLHGRIFTYADDTAIVYEEYNHQQVQQDLNKIADFFRINVLSINASKTNYMLIKSPHKEAPPAIQPLFINDTQICLVNDTRYLGLRIDNNLTWKLHIEALSKEISKPIGIMHKLKYRLKTPTLKLIYHSLVHSKLSYMINIWGSAKKYIKKQVYTLQNRAVKSIHKLPMLFSTSSLFGIISKEILPIEKIYKKSMLMFVQQCINNKIHHTIEFHHTTHRSTRAVTEKKLIIPSMRTERYGKEGIMYRACSFYNQLPQEIKSLSNIYQFKKQLQIYLTN